MGESGAISNRMPKARGLLQEHLHRLHHHLHPHHHNRLQNHRRRQRQQQRQPAAQRVLRLQQLLRPEQIVLFIIVFDAERSRAKPLSFGFR